ncbi:MAG: 2-C-methyl-D-erythritol 4-phosphate cytidylyltransferase [Acidobacteria bacterium]|nr:2-C-methyl-D-erythritol 4-phosphate cytidylyltransferase [Acidobacteriota bacterium]
MNTAIIVAAGDGTRFGGDKPKQFLEIAGKPIVIYALECFEFCPQIDQIILVLPATEIENFRQIAARFDLKKLVKMVAGGRTRAASVWNGLSAIDAESADIIAVHDGARPLVTSAEIRQTIQKARQTGAACLVAGVTDTIKEISGDKIARTVERARLRRALTPQCFRYEILKRAFETNDFKDSATDESFLVEQIGVAVSIVEGGAQNIKITHAEDLILAESLLLKSAVYSPQSAVESGL